MMMPPGWLVISHQAASLAASLRSYDASPAVALALFLRPNVFFKGVF
jgi:hypothetical protein